MLTTVTHKLHWNTFYSWELMLWTGTNVQIKLHYDKKNEITAPSHNQQAHTWIFCFRGLPWLPGLLLGRLNWVPWHGARYALVLPRHMDHLEPSGERLLLEVQDCGLPQLSIAENLEQGLVSNTHCELLVAHGEMAGFLKGTGHHLGLPFHGGVSWLGLT